MKKKLFILIFFLLCVTGCNANYNVEIYNNQVKEDMQFVETDSSSWDSEAKYGLSYRSLLEASINYPYPVFDDTIVDENDTIKLDGVEYYNNSLISDATKLGQRLKYNKFTLDNFNQSSIIKKCYKYFNIIEEEDNIVISTSYENLCFKEYPMLDRITINLKTNHKVVSSNATRVKGYHYTWDLTKDKSDDSAITIIIKKDDYIFNYENEIIKKIIYIALIVGIILSIGSICYFYFKNKNKRLNEI